MIYNALFIILDAVIYLVYIYRIKTVRMKMPSIILLAVFCAVQVFVFQSVFSNNVVSLTAVICAAIYLMFQKVGTSEAIYSSLFPMVMARIIIDTVQILMIHQQGYKPFIQMWLTGGIYIWMLLERVLIVFILGVFIRIKNHKQLPMSGFNSTIILIVTVLMHFVLIRMEQTTFSSSSEFSRNMVVLLMILAVDSCLPLLAYGSSRNTVAINDLSNDNERLLNLNKETDMHKDDSSTLAELKHDFHHLQQTINGNDSIEAGRLSEEYSEDLSRMYYIFHTNHKILNSLLDYYNHLAAEEHIEFQVISTYSMIMDISDNDLNSILGNMLENAFKYRDKDSEIRVELSDRANYVWVLVTDKTSKTEFTEGIGMASIRSHVERNGGSVFFRIQDGTFKASVLIPAHLSREESESSQKD